MRPIGGSMRGRIESGQLVRWLLSLQGGRYEIGNNLGKINGTVAADDLLGMVVAVSD